METKEDEEKDLWWLQHTSLSPNGKLLLIFGDNPGGTLMDTQNGSILQGSAIFVARNRFAVLDKSSNLIGFRSWVMLFQRENLVTQIFYSPFKLIFSSKGKSYILQG